jgi:hypothetical protein
LAVLNLHANATAGVGANTAAHTAQEPADGEAAKSESVAATQLPLPYGV